MWYVSYAYKRLDGDPTLWLYGDRIIDVHPIEWLMETRQNKEKYLNLKYVILFWSEIGKSEKYAEIFRDSTTTLPENTVDL